MANNNGCSKLRLLLAAFEIGPHLGQKAGSMGKMKLGRAKFWLEFRVVDYW